MDYATLGVYYAPTSLKNHEDTAKKLTEWLALQVDKLGVSTAPVTGGDINSDFGLHREQCGQVTRTKQKSIGPFANKLEKPSGKESRQCVTDAAW